LSSNSCSFWKNCTVSKVLLQMGRKITRAQSLKQKSRTKGMQLYSEDKHGIKRQTKSRAIEIHFLTCWSEHNTKMGANLDPWANSTKNHSYKTWYRINQHKCRSLGLIQVNTTFRKSM
jgi:hypothetical protein